jgi:hypothetical protein
MTVADPRAGDTRIMLDGVECLRATVADSRHGFCDIITGRVNPKTFEGPEILRVYGRVGIFVGARR